MDKKTSWSKRTVGQKYYFYTNKQSDGTGSKILFIPGSITEVTVWQKYHYNTNRHDRQEWIINKLVGKNRRPKMLLFYQKPSDGRYKNKN